MDWKFRDKIKKDQAQTETKTARGKEQHILCKK